MDHIDLFVIVTSLMCGAPHHAKFCIHAPMSCKREVKNPVGSSDTIVQTNRVNALAATLRADMATSGLEAAAIGRHKKLACTLDFALAMTAVPIHNLYSNTSRPHTFILSNPVTPG